MRARILGADQWEAGLAGTELPPLLPHVHPDNAAMVIVENGNQVVASMAVLRVSHFEGAWIAPEWRGNAAVVRALLRHSCAVANARGDSFVLAGAADEPVRALLGKMGGAKLPMDFFALSLKGEPCRQQ